MTVEIKTPPALNRLRDIAKPAMRRRMFAAIADTVTDLVQRHILRISPAHHIWANKLGAQPTGHFEKGARLTHATAGSNFAEVVIPIPGISRAFRPLTITPVKAAALTIPIAQQSYGHLVSDMRRNGWKIFRPKGKDVLMGEQNDQGPVALYLLRKRVEQRQDRSLLPSDLAISSAAGRAIEGYLDRVAKGAS